MQDDEYPAYLKKQSYDDLLGISSAIDREGQPRRYGLVLAEIAERDSRGEGKAMTPDGRGGKPAAVTKAVTLLFIGLGSAIACSFFTLSIFVQMNVLEFRVCGFVSWMLMVWLIFHINQGRNWARIALLVLCLLSMPFFVLSLFKLFSMSLVSGGLSLFRIGLDIIALILLFGREADPWFCPPKAVPPTTAGAPVC